MARRSGLEGACSCAESSSNGEGPCTLVAVVGIGWALRRTGVVGTEVGVVALEFALERRMSGGVVAALVKVAGELFVLLAHELLWTFAAKCKLPAPRRRWLRSGFCVWLPFTPDR